MNTVQPSPQSSEPASLSLNFVEFTSTRPDRLQPAPTHASGIETAVFSNDVNTISLITDPTASPEASTPSASLSATEAPSGRVSSRKSQASSILIIAITLPVIATFILGVLLVWYLIRPGRRRRAESTPNPQPKILRRPRRLSDFWSADASKPESRTTSALAMMMATTPTEAQNSPRTPNENAGLLGQDRAIRQLSRSTELIIAVGLAGGAYARNSGSGRLVPSAGVDRYATTSNDIQQPASAYYPERLVSNRNVDVEQQMMDLPGMVQPRISESYLDEPRASTRRAVNPISPLALPSPLHGPIAAPDPGQTFEPAQHPVPPSQPSPPPPHREFSNLTFISMEPFALDDLVLGPATQSSHIPSHVESPAQPSMLSSTEPRPSVSSSHLPRTPRPVLQPDVLQALTNLQRPASRSTYLHRTTSNSSTIGTFSTTHKPRLDVLPGDPNHPPNAFAPGYFMHMSPKIDILEGPQLPRPSLEAPSVISGYSNPSHLCASRNGSGSPHGAESEFDGVRYSREDGRSSPALPDSVRTSVLSYSEGRR
ncbi:hypothetical protein FRC10_007390 [Ceratobasidium sp. 414]|nr:hypothetical protein FRC10_007390 [Ceratobasidium sp. 414]